MRIPRREFLRLVGSGVAVSWAAGCRPEPGPDAAGVGEVGVSMTQGGLLVGSWPPYGEAVVFDGLSGPLQINIPQGGLPLSEAALRHFRDSGITAVNLTVNALPSDEMTAYEATVEKLTAWLSEVENRPGQLTIARSTEEIRAAKAVGRLALVLGFQDGVPFEDDLDRVDEFYASGVRIVQLTYNIENKIGAGCLAPRDTGLTELGRTVVARLNELGVLVDLSHCGPRTSLDGVRASRQPVSFTHTGCNALYRHPRNKDDEALRLLSERGGVVGIYLMPFLNAEGSPSAEDVLDHIEHALNVCGEDHVGIGSDQGIVPLDLGGDFRTRFEEVSVLRAEAGIAAPREDTVPFVPELNHPRRMETIAAMMAERGHPGAVIEKVIGGNFIRLLDDVWT